MRRYFRVLLTFWRTSLLAELEYRLNFLLALLSSLGHAVGNTFGLSLFYTGGGDLGGWPFFQALLVMGVFTTLSGLNRVFLSPNLARIVEHTRTGTLDFVLLKPADAQFLVSTAKFSPWRATNALTACVMFGYAFHLLGRLPSPGGIALALLLLASSTLLLYSLWILTVSAAFYVVRIDNLTYLFNAIFDAARWPASVFRGFWAILFTFVIPLALMTTYPALALLDELSPRSLALAAGGSLLFAALARAMWLRSIARYTSAGG